MAPLWRFSSMFSIDFGGFFFPEVGYMFIIGFLEVLFLVVYLGDFKRREPHKHVGRLPKCMDAFLLETNNVCMYKITELYHI